MNPIEKAHAQKLARVIRAARKVTGHSQGEMAKLLGISQSAWSKMEAGILIPSAPHWFLFCENVGLDSKKAFEFGYIDHCLPVAESGVYPESSFNVPKVYARNARTKVRSTIPALTHFRHTHGEEALQQYLKTLRLDPDLLLVMDYQLNIRFQVDLLEKLVSDGRMKDADLTALVSSVTEGRTHGELQYQYNFAESQRGLLDGLFANLDKYDTSFKFEVEDQKQNRCVLSATPDPSLDEADYKSEILGDLICRYRKRYLEVFSTYGNHGPAVSIEENECHFHGADRCVYQIIGAA